MQKIKIIILTATFCFTFLSLGFASVSYAEEETKENPNLNEADANDITLNMPFGSKKEDEIIKIDKNTTSFSLISSYISKVYNWGAAVTGLLAVLMIVVGGVQYILAGADSSLEGEAKGRIQQALFALTLLLLSGLILHTINPNFFTY